MTTFFKHPLREINTVVEAYRLGRYDNFEVTRPSSTVGVVEAYRLGRYDNFTKSITSVNKVLL